MRIVNRAAVVLVAALTMLVGLSMPASAQGKTSHLGTRSLATVLAQDGSGFDRNWNDFDITDHAVAAVLAAKPNSPVAVLADGKTPLTAFLPTDRAFRRLAQDLTGKRYRSEKAVFTDLATQLGVDTIESVLLYHVVPGATITYKQALRSSGAVLTTALAGSTVRVKVLRHHRIALVDADRNDTNPIIVRVNINKGNVQIAHGINRVLRPVDLP
jgi:uncharacterized surface protein with fasciclin (FAS1) repeats